MLALLLTDGSGTDRRLVFLADYDKLLATVAFLFRSRGSDTCAFVTSFQARSSTPSLVPLLLKWSLAIELVPLSDFIEADRLLDYPSLELAVITRATP